jgi:hypothetical protein
MANQRGVMVTKVISAQSGAKGGLRSNGYEGNTEHDGAHKCCAEKALPGVSPLRGLELRLREFLLVERVREATSYEVVT